MRKAFALLLLGLSAYAQGPVTGATYGPKTRDQINKALATAGGGASTAGANGDIQMKNGSALAAAPINCVGSACTAAGTFSVGTTVIDPTTGIGASHISAVPGATGDVLMRTSGGSLTNSPINCVGNNCTVIGTITSGASGSATGVIDLATGTTPTNPASGVQSIFLNSSTSNHLSRLDSAGTIIDIEASLGNITIGTTTAISGTEGSILGVHSGAVAQDNANLSWDFTNHKLITSKMLIGSGFTLAALSGVNLQVGANVNDEEGLEIRNLNTGAGAGMVYAVTDTSNHRLEMAQYGVNNSGVLFGLTRSAMDVIFTTGGTTRDLVIGNASAKSLMLGTNNLIRMTLDSAGNFGFSSGKGQHLVTQAANNDLTGTVTVSASTTGSLTFTTPYTNAPKCSISPQSDPTTTGTYWVTTSTTAVTANVSISGTISFTFVCVGNPN